MPRPVTMKASQGLCAALPFIPFVLAVGCRDSSGGTASPLASASISAPVATAPSASAKPVTMVGDHGGIAASLFRAAPELTLTREQVDSLDKIEAGLKSDDDGIRAAMKAFRTDLLAGVKSGKLDTAKLTADDAIVDKAFAGHKDQEASALNSLHELLAPPQRLALVGAVRSKETQREAHVSGWMKASDGGPPDWVKSRLDKLTADLTLDATQQKQVAAILAKSSDPPNGAGMQARWDDVKKRRDALLTAFAGATFDAKGADLTIVPGKTAHDPADHIVAFLSQLLPILRPDQRDKLATSMDRPFGARESQGATPAGAARHPVDDIEFPFVEPAGTAGADSPTAKK